MSLRLSIPREPHPPATAEQRLSLFLLKGTRLLVRNGMDRLRRNWDHLPQVKVPLLRQGTALDQALQSTRPNALSELAVRGGKWYIKVRLLRSSGSNGGDATPSQAAALADIREEFVANAPGAPNGDPPDNRHLVNAMLKLVDVVENLDRGQTELRRDVADLKAGQAKLEVGQAKLEVGQAKLEAGQARLDGRMDNLDGRMDNLEGRMDNLEGRMGNLEGRMDNLDGRMGNLEGRIGNRAGREYEDQFRNYLPNQIHMACRQANLPHPQVELLWTDRHSSNWETRRADLGIEDSKTELPYCDFLYRLWWEDVRIPDLLLAGETSITVDDRVLAKAKRHRTDLEAVGHQARTLLVGADFTPRVAERGGSEAVAEEGVEWLERPADLEDRAWQDTTEIGDMLKAWHAEIDARAGF